MMGDILEFKEKIKLADTKSLEKSAQSRLESCFKTMHKTGKNCGCDYCVYRTKSAKRLFKNTFEKTIVDAKVQNLDLTAQDVQLIFYEAIGQVTRYLAFVENDGKEV